MFRKKLYIFWVEKVTVVKYGQVQNAHDVYV